ncbi:MinD/ParA family ATP-binding protein [Streptomonospora wellingtoniae]|uniref:Uncharacterized protein n=1 Tax=Streptomonospora wellingtoniae TaxID=3075544 RepID=A0ABU2KYA8_9ACTN|nr:hypothetical protein [Streptomonospora sp. DSM 45055]MDT0304233.1 hypothetical protein [Streptomonospora sp. DSM 45055]
MHDSAEPSAGRAAPRVARHGDSLLRRVGRGAARPFRPPEDILAPVRLGRDLQRSVITGRRVVVSRPHGWAAESTVTALLALAFAHYRYDRVLALDLGPGNSGLGPRLGAADPARPGLAGGTIESDSFDEVAQCMEQVGEGLWLLPKLQEEIAQGTLDANRYQNAVLPLTRFFGLTVIDRAADVSDGLNRAAQASAHAHVLVVPSTREGAASIGRAFDWMAANGAESLPRRIVVVFTEQTRGDDRAFDFGGSAAILRESGAEVFRLGFDRHLAEGTRIDPSRISAATHATATRIAAECLRRSL